MTDFVELTSPPEPGDSSSMRRWTFGISLIATLGVIFFAWSLSKWGFAMATDVAAMSSDVDKKVDAALAPMNREIAEIKKEQADQRRIIDDTKQLAIENQASDFEGKIVDFKNRQCKAQKDEAATTWRQLVLDYQNRYLRLTDRNFPAPSCADL